MEECGRRGWSLAAPTSHDAGRVRAAREPNDPQGDEGADGRIAHFAKDQGVRQAQGNGVAVEILEARQSTKSDART